jgi:hypothetical protein
MKHYEVEATPTHYRVEVEQTVLTQEPAILEQNGKPVAILLPITEYEAYRTWQATSAARTKTLRPQTRSSPALLSPAFEQEVLAFERMKPQLLAQYPGRVVAIYQARVVAVGDNRLDVLDQVWDQFGEVSCYVENVQAETPRRARMPSVRISR